MGCSPYGLNVWASEMYCWVKLLTLIRYKRKYPVNNNRVRFLNTVDGLGPAVIETVAPLRQFDGFDKFDTPSFSHMVKSNWYDCFFPSLDCSTTRFCSINSGIILP